jgi:hypothetical protein
MLWLCKNTFENFVGLIMSYKGVKLFLKQKITSWCDKLGDFEVSDKIQFVMI